MVDLKTERCSHCDRVLELRGTSTEATSLYCGHCGREWSVHFPPSLLHPELRPDLVRCGCGVVHHDADRRVPLVTLQGLMSFQMQEEIAGLDEGLEPPRSCRRCGCVYMLPKQQAPSKGNAGNTPPA